MEISKGIEFHHIKTEKFKTTIICILLRRNLNKEEVTKNALIANILKNGSSKYPTIKDINIKIENMYGSIFDVQIIKKSEEQLFQFYFEMPSNDENIFNEAIEFLENIIFNPLKEIGFSEKYFNREKIILKETIEGRINNKYSFAKDRCFEIMCKDEPFGIYGDGYLEDIEKIDNENLFNHYINILNESPIEIIIIGNYEKEKILKITEKYFCKNRKEIIKLNKPINKFYKNEVKKYKDSIGVNQGKICIGLRCKGDIKEIGFYKLILFNELLGGGSSSKLYGAVREKESLCYYIKSYLYGFKSIIFIESGVDFNAMEKTTDIIIEQLKKISQGDFNNRDIETAKKSLIKKYCSIEDSQSMMIDFYMSQYLADDKSKINDIISGINNINREDLLSAGENIYVDMVYYLE